MSRQVQQRADSATSAVVYTQRGNQAFEDQLAQRTAAAEAAFFLPALRPGMALRLVMTVWLQMQSGPKQS